jgi:hypothetical protein
MGIRERINDNRGVTIGVIAAVIVLAVGAVVMQVMAGRKAFKSGLPELYYTVDDGKTFFAANSKNVPPFDYQGKTAVKAYVFRCPNGKLFVGYVERYNEAAQKLILAGKGTIDTQVFGRELKKPGDTKWVKSGDNAAVAKVTDIKCPDGQSGEPEPVEPD